MTAPFVWPSMAVGMPSPDGYAGIGSPSTSALPEDYADTGEWEPQTASSNLYGPGYPHQQAPQPGLLERLADTGSKVGHGLVGFGKSFAEDLDFLNSNISGRERIYRLANVGSYFLPPLKLGMTASLGARMAAKALETGTVSGGLAAIHGSPIVPNAVAGAGLGSLVEGLLTKGRRWRTGSLSSAASQAFENSGQDFSNLSKTPLNSQPWAVVGGQLTDGTVIRLPDDVNATRHAKLGQEIRNLGYDPVEVKGFGPDQQPNQYEDSWMVPGMKRQHALELAEAYGQESVLTNEGLIRRTDGQILPIKKSGYAFGNAINKHGEYFTSTPWGDFSAAFDAPIQVTQKVSRTLPADPVAAKLESLIYRPNGPAPMERILNLPIRTSLESWYTHLVRSFHGVEQFESALGRGGLERPDQLNISELSQLYAGWSGYAEHAFEFGIPDWNDRTKIVAPGLKTILARLQPGDWQDFEHYGKAKRFLHLHDTKDAGLPAALTPEELQSLIARIDENQPHIKGIFDDYVNWRNKYVENTLVKSGALGEDAFKAIEEHSKDYVPLRKPMESRDEMIQATGAAKRYIINNPVKKITQIGSEFEPWTHAVIHDMYRFSRIGHMQDMADTLIAKLEELDPTASKLFAEKINVLPPELTAMQRSVLDELKASDPELAKAAEHTTLDMTSVLAPTKLFASGYIGSYRPATGFIDESGKILSHDEANKLLDNGEAMIDRSTAQPAPGMTRLYRGETASAEAKPVPDWVKNSPEFKGNVDAAGRWFSDNVAAAQYYAKNFGETGKITYVDVPTNQLENYRASNQEAGKFSAQGRAGEEFFVPRDMADARKEFSPKAEPVDRLNKPAIKFDNGQVVEGETHALAQKNAIHDAVATGLPFDSYKYSDLNALGYTTQAGKFVGKNEALDTLRKYAGPELQAKLARRDAMNMPGFDSTDLLEFSHEMQPEVPDLPGLRPWSGRERVWYKITDPNLWEAFKAMKPADMGLLTKLFAGVASTLRAGATLALEFMVRNPMKDLPHAFVTTGTKPTSIAAGFAHVIGRDEVFQRYLASGGGRASMVAQDRDSIRMHINDALGLDETKGIGKFYNVIKSPIEGLQALSDWLETGTRVGVFDQKYKELLRNGIAPAEATRRAGLASRNATVDFGVHGSSTNSVRMMTAFWNAQIQGYDNLVRSFAADPKGAALRATAMITLPSTILYLLNRNDPEYYQLPSWERDMFWHVKMPDSMPWVGDHWMRFPKPFDLGYIFGSSVERFMQFLDADDPKALDALAYNYLSKNIGDLMPIPTVGRPILENMMNRSFLRNRPIESRGMEDIAPEYRIQPGTSDFAQQLGKWTGSSPIKIDNLVRGYFGGLGQVGTDIGNAVVNIHEGKPLLPQGGFFDPRDVPGLRGLFSQFPRQSEDIDKLYDVADQIREAEYTRAHLRQTMQIDDLVDWMQQKSILLGSSKSINNMLNQMKSLRTARDMILRDKTMPSNQRSEQLDSISRAMLAVASAAGPIEDMIKDQQNEQR